MKTKIESPFAGCNALLHITPKKMLFRKDEFEVYDYYYICEKTKKEFTTTEATDITLKQLYNQYREKNNILFPEQIKKLRSQYGLSASKMSEVLGFGENVYRNYENGEIPGKSNSKTLNLIKHTKNFLELVVESGLFSEYELDELRKISINLANKSKEEFIKKFLRNYTDEIDQFTGFALRHYKKLANMVIFFLQENERAYTTRLNKCLFYSDFISYKYNGHSISGYTYCAIDKGPVLDNYKRLFSELWEENYIESVEQKIGETTIDKFIPAKEFDRNIFNDDEIEILKFVSGHFKFKSTDELIKLSHKEKAWQENIASKSNISYQLYAPLLNF
jgi:DNA-binding transcriptional regulator YiaG